MIAQIQKLIKQISATALIKWVGETILTMFREWALVLAPALSAVTAGRISFQLYSADHWDIAGAAAFAILHGAAIEASNYWVWKSAVKLRNFWIGVFMIVTGTLFTLVQILNSGAFEEQGAFALLESLEVLIALIIAAIANYAKMIFDDRVESDKQAAKAAAAEKKRLESLEDNEKDFEREQLEKDKEVARVIKIERESAKTNLKYGIGSLNASGDASGSQKIDFENEVYRLHEEGKITSLPEATTKMFAAWEVAREAAGSGSRKSVKEIAEVSAQSTRNVRDMFKKVYNLNYAPNETGD